jgi:hypothetical protein
MGCQCRRAGRACQAGEPRRAGATQRHIMLHMGDVHNPAIMHARRGYHGCRASALQKPVAEARAMARRLRNSGRGAQVGSLGRAAERARLGASFLIAPLCPVRPLLCLSLHTPLSGCHRPLMPWSKQGCAPGHPSQHCSERPCQPPWPTARPHRDAATRGQPCHPPRASGTACRRDHARESH